MRHGGSRPRLSDFLPKAWQRGLLRARPRIYGLQHRTSLLAAPFETDRKDESEIGIGNGGWRWRQWRGACEQEKRLGIEYRRAGTIDDLTVQHVTLPIDTEVEIDDA